ncbi:MAG: MATE family efflux transporter [Clostridia bacterium]|nr:MATE family efflux transporter [Clostridia bacterium]
MTKDMTVGRPMPLIIAFFFPLLAGNLFQQLYNMVDMMIVGRFVGTGALAAVGSTGSLHFLVIGLISGLCTGFCIPVSRTFGAGDGEGMRRAVAAGTVLSSGISVVIAVVTALGCGWLLTIMDTPADIFADAQAYISLLFWGIPATTFYNYTAGLLRAVGDSRTPLICLIISSLCNIALDLFFILAFDMGVVGAALATVIAQVLSGVLCLWQIVRHLDLLHPRGREWMPRASVCRQLLGVGLPMGFQFSITAIGTIVVQAAVNSLGTDIVAAVTAGNKVQNLVNQPLESLGVTVATYCSQNLGAGRIDRVKSGMRQITLFMVGLSLLGSAIAFFGGRYILLLFLDSSETFILGEAQRFLNFNCIFYVFLGVVLVFRNAIQGLGYATPAMLAGVLELIARSAVAICLTPVIGFTAVMMAHPAAWIAADAFLLLPFYFYILHRLNRNLSKAPRTAGGGM